MPVARASQHAFAMQLARVLEEQADTIAVPAEPNGLAMHGTALFIADDRSGAVMNLDGKRVATIDSGGIACTNRLGGLAAGPDGTFFVARLGYGAVGAVFYVDPDGRTTALDDFPGRFWRLGVAYCPDKHALFTTQFLKRPSGPCDGTVARTDLATGDTTIVADGFLKPVAVAKLDDTLIVTDARLRAVYRVDRIAGAPVRSALAVAIGRPDSLAIAGPDSVYVTTFDETTGKGALRQLWLDGQVRTLAEGAWEPRGVTACAGVVYVSLRRVERILIVHDVP
jgi:sugar lactone lactonase YvrE